MSVETVAEAAQHHSGVWAARAYFSLGETDERVELVDGALLVSPLAMRPHQRLVKRLTMVLDGGCPEDFEVFPGLNVELDSANVRIPDVVVARRGGSDEFARAADVLVVAEITSRSNFRQDRIIKHGQYAQAGIPFYLRVDLHLGVEDLTATAYELVGGRYVEHASAPDGVLRIVRPWPVEIDLRAAARG
ncbi:Uma2 family endonuclease [Pseudonocardia sp. CA-107938]|uniref:Uma2 family endonuclease n=1 Tax=Pseudonocardia sp. CA-107938 TaxID=3240021 RepID=UPI003D92A8D3